MTDSSKSPTPPEGLPDEIVADLNQLDHEELRKTIIHAQELLQFEEENQPPVEPGPGEDIIRVTEHEGYTEVVKTVTCPENCADCPHGPYLYHVTMEPRPEGGEKAHWTFLGKVKEED